MNGVESNAQLPTPLVGEALPGLFVRAEDRPEGMDYWDQVIDSSYGSLFYAPEQFRDGMLRWVTNHGEVCIKVESGSGRVAKIDTEAQEKHSDLYTYIYDMGMDAYQELKRRIEAGEALSDLT